ncbi:MAG: hypothetical protein IRZ29_07615 [Thermoflavifilum sp.]|nr:hypothetical protein [Thermoflavifilum sp.]
MGHLSAALIHGYLQRALEWLQAYTGEMPLHRFLKHKFRQHPQLGARDRHFITALLYDYFRLGHSFPGRTAAEKMLIGFLVCEKDPAPLIQVLLPAWMEACSRPEPIDRASWFPDFRVEEIFPWQWLLSASLDARAFALSYLQQPEVFVRIRPGHERVFTTLDLPMRKLEENILAFPAGLDLKHHLPAMEGIDYVVQDYASQQVMAYLVKYLQQLQPGKCWNIWDCCAGSGGKSIYLYDYLSIGRLVVTDIRASILTNLSKRFQLAGLKKYTAVPVDVRRETELKRIMGRMRFQLILADVPCTGSGTWARTPEQLHFFLPEQLTDFQQSQLAILRQATKYLEPGGYLAYITCSVFKPENEDVVAALQADGLQLIDSRLIAGYASGGDALYVALLKAR